MVKGSKTDLIDKVRNGANIRVMHISPNSDHLYVTSVQNAFAVGNELCGQALFNVSKKDYSRFQVNIYRSSENFTDHNHVKISRFKNVIVCLASEARV